MFCVNFRVLFFFCVCVGVNSNLYILRCNISYFTICLKRDILYKRRTQIHKVKNHDGYTPNQHTRILGSLHMLLSMVPNFREKTRHNHLWRRKGIMAHSQEKHTMLQPQMETNITQKRKNRRLRMRLRLQIHAKTTPILQQTQEQPHRPQTPNNLFNGIPLTPLNPLNQASFSLNPPACV